MKPRKPKKILLLFVIAVLSFTIAIITSSSSRGFSFVSKYLETLITSSKQSGVLMNMGVSVCGNRLEESLVMIKSVTLLTQAPFHIHIFVSDKLKESMRTELISWQHRNQNHMSFTLYSPQLPTNDSKGSINLFRPCASQRLFMPAIVKDVDAIVYVDTDVVFLRSLEDLWKHFDNFNVKQIAGVARESESSTRGYYIHRHHIPYVPPSGINSGVLLMNATRIRQIEWLSNISDIQAKYKRAIRLGDQDIVNIYFNKYPDQLYNLSCDWNYRADHCRLSNNCTAAEYDGVGLVHGNDFAFHRTKAPIIQQLYQSFLKYKFGEDAYKYFNKSAVKILEKNMNNTKLKCSNAATLFFINFPKNLPKNTL